MAIARLKFKHSFSLLFGAVFLHGCASAPPSSRSVESITHENIRQQAADKRYALLQWLPIEKKWVALSVSEARPKFNRPNQEIILISTHNNNIDVTPSWDYSQIWFHEDIKTGKRTGIRYGVDGSDHRLRDTGYTPENSKFGYEDREGRVGLTHKYSIDAAELKRAVSESNVLKHAENYSAGAPSLPTAAPQVKSLNFNNQVWLTRAGHKPEDFNKRVYFVPAEAQLYSRIPGADNLDFAEEGSKLFVNIGENGNQWTSLENILRFRIEASAGGCHRVDLTTKTLPQGVKIICHSTDQMVRADSPALGSKQGVIAFRGKLYDATGGLISRDHSLRADMLLTLGFEAIVGEQANKLLKN